MLATPVEAHLYQHVGRRVMSPVSRCSRHRTYQRRLSTQNILHHPVGEILNGAKKTASDCQDPRIYNFYSSIKKNINSIFKFKFLTELLQVSIDSLPVIDWLFLVKLLRTRANSFGLYQRLCTLTCGTFFYVKLYAVAHT